MDLLVRDNECGTPNPFNELVAHYLGDQSASEYTHSPPRDPVTLEKGATKEHLGENVNASQVNSVLSPLSNIAENEKEGREWVSEFNELNQKFEASEDIGKGKEPVRRLTHKKAACVEDDGYLFRGAFSNQIQDMYAELEKFEEAPAENLLGEKNEKPVHYIDNEIDSSGYYEWVDQYFSSRNFAEKMEELGLGEGNAEIMTDTSDQSTNHNSATRPYQSHWDVMSEEWENVREEFLESKKTERSKSEKKELSGDYIFEPNNPYLSVEKPLKEGVDLLKCGELADAILYFEAALKVEPTCAYAWKLLGAAHAENENDPQSISACLKCLSLSKGDLETLLILACGYVNLVQFANASETLYEYIKIFRGNLKHDDETGLENTQPELLVDYGLLRKLFADTVKELGDDVNADLLIAQGVVLSITSEFDGAAETFNRALRHRPKDPMLWNKLGASYANGGRYVEAANAYEKALFLNPGFVRARYNLGICCLNLEAYSEACDCFSSCHLIQRECSADDVSRISGASVESDGIWNLLALTLEHMKKPEAAIRARNQDKSLLDEL
eukprot:Nk52_evm41s217 gene=Nk52_evmTU41s217